jgi:hypothetical protein
MRRFLIATCVVLAALGAVSAASAGPSLGKLALKPAQIGPGYKLQLRADTSCVQRCVTLDMCGFEFTSELARTGRYQVNYLHPGPAVQLSEEIVTYRPRASILAMHELERAVATCPKAAVASHVKGVPPLTYRLKRLHDRRLLPGSVALQVHVTATQGGKTFEDTTVAIYQFRNDVLSGVDSYARKGVTLADQIRVGFNAAAASAAILKRAT